LISFKYEIKNIIQAQEAIYSLNKDRGAQGILINKNRDESGNVPLMKSQKDELQKQFNAYGLSEKQKKSSFQTWMSIGNKYHIAFVI